MTDLQTIVRPRHQPTDAPRRERATIERPTIALAALIYAGWLAATYWHDRLNPIALAAVGGWLIAWQSALQHEVIHGHPTPWRRLNDALGAPPLSLWMPYEIYRRSHLAHHASETLADPSQDPEARYLSRGQGAPHRWALAAARLQATLTGRLVLGPILEVGRFLAVEAGRVARGEPGRRAIWARHLAGVAIIGAWLQVACGLNLGEYLLLFVYPGVALTLLRSFAEHRADAVPGHRVAVVERAPLFGLLFLNNNLHAVHHLWPGLAWWRLPGRFRAEREVVLAGNGGLLYAGYADVARRFLFRPHDAPVYPLAQDGAP